MQMSVKYWPAAEDFDLNTESTEIAAVSRALQETRAVSPAEVDLCVGVPDDLSDLPKIVMSIGPCCSGAGVFLRVFSASGIRAVDKPLKGILRRQLQESGQYREPSWKFPLVPTIYLRESIGAYSLQECTFNPLDVLFRVFMRHESSTSKARERLREKVVVLISGQLPEDNWLSWRSKYEQVVPRDTLFRNFLVAHQTVAKIRAQAVDWKVPVVHYMHEAHMRAHTAIPGLFRKLSLPNVSAISGWKQFQTFPGEESNIEIPDQPAIYHRTGQFDHILNSDGLRYFAKTEAELRTITDAERRTIHDFVTPLYVEWRQSSEQDLGITIPDPE